jgi:hypothetical protein
VCPNRGRIVKLQLNSHFPTQQELFSEFGYFALVASQKQTGFSLEAAIDLQARGQSFQFANRVVAQLVAPGRSHRADLFDQVTQGNINFVLEQGGTRAGAARSDVPLIKDNGLHSGFGQVNGHQSPGYPTTDDNRITRNIAL